LKRSAFLAVVLVTGAGCAPALHDPPPVARLGPDILPPGSVRDGPATVDRLLAEAEAVFGRRDGKDDVRAAQRLFLEAARADESRVEGLLGLARSTAWLVEHASDAEERGSLVTLGVEAAQLCAARAPANAACDYALAIALGQQARERHATGRDGLAKMVAALRRAIATDPGLDGGGPHRVLALVYLRAPGWPAGPGDSEAGLAEARAAVALFPDHPANVLALAEALRRNGRPSEALAACARAKDLANARRGAGDPDASEWLAEANRGLGPA
jgi:hypothetical protein